MLLLHFRVAWVIASKNTTEKVYRFGIMPKSTNNRFYDPVREGCEARAASYDINVLCDWVGPDWEDLTGKAQASVLNTLIDAKLAGDPDALDGIAVAVVNEDALQEPFQRALAAGMSVICFDSDSFKSSRQAYVGTDNFAFGEQLGKVLLQLRPEGGVFSVATFRGPNLLQRVSGIRFALEGTTWKELPDSILYEDITKPELGLQHFEDLKRSNPELGAIVPTFGTFMEETSLWMNHVNSRDDMTFVVADALPHQIVLMERGFADGLVGQLPYQSGELCIETMLELQQQGNPPRMENNDLLFGTNLSFFLRIPLILPDLKVDMNYVENFRIIGYSSVGLLWAATSGVTAWVVYNWKTRIVQASQPIFLLMIVLGVFIMSSSIIPMGIDDQHNSTGACTAACNATPWLISMGFSMTFSALFSKLWRINRLIQSAQRFSKAKVTVRDVMLPFCILMAANLTILICWTVIDPLHYTRTDHLGTDPWNRIISTYGSCESADGDRSLPYLVSLAVVNFGALAVANFQAYKTRQIRSAYSESKYVGVVVASMTQAGLVGLPVLLLVDEAPQVKYLVRVLLVFVICLAILGFMFVPKILHHRREEETQMQSRVSVSFGPTSYHQDDSGPASGPFPRRSSSLGSGEFLRSGSALARNSCVSSLGWNSAGRSPSEAELGDLLYTSVADIRLAAEAAQAFARKLDAQEENDIENQNERRSDESKSEVGQASSSDSLGFANSRIIASNGQIQNHDSKAYTDAVALRTLLCSVEEEKLYNKS